MTTATSLLIVALAMFSGQAPAKDAKADRYGLPPLHVMRHAILGPTYSCRTTSEFSQGYQQTALFLSDYSRERNAPDLLFNGACGSENYFQASTSGDDMALVADLGSNVPLTAVTFERAFSYKTASGLQAESQFSMSAQVIAGHTYVVLINRPDVRGLMVLTVTAFEPDKMVEFNYAVKSYTVQQSAATAVGFDPARENHD